MFDMVAAVTVIASFASIICPIWGNEKVLGPADVTVKHVDKCPNPEEYSYKIEVERIKLSRFQDAFSANVTIDKTMDEQMGMFINVNKYGDGGWKTFFVMDKSNACDYFMQQSEVNFKMALEKMGAPQKCPVAAGSYAMQNFIVDYSAIPEDLMYGSFLIDVFITDASMFNKRVLCVRIYVDLTPKREE